MTDTFEHAGLTVRIEPDEDAFDPRDNDNIGVMVCWHRRSDLGDQTIRTEDYESREELIEPFGDTAVLMPLYLYEHSGMTMRVGEDIGGGDNPFHCPWDSGQVGFIYALREKVIDEYGDDSEASIEQARQYLTGEVEEYDRWLTGDVWGYVIEDEGGENLDSCWGFFGMDYCKEEARSVAEHIAERLAKQRAQDAEEEAERDARKLEASRPDMYGTED